MARSRRALLCGGAVALAGLSGCLSTPGSGGSTPTTAPSTARTPEDSLTGSSPTSTLTRTFTPLPDGRRVDFPEGPKSPPPFPDSLDRSAVVTFARSYEYRYVYNSLHHGPSTEIDLSCSVERVRELDVGWRVVVSCTGSSTTGGEPVENSTATSTVMHADWFTQTYVYLVDRDSVVRRRYEGDG